MAFNSALVSSLTAAIKAAAKFVPGINPRAIEFVCHYIGGSQTPMVLTGDEIALLKEALLEVIRYYPEDRQGGVPGHEGAWLTHPTKGLVGGFTYKLVLEGDQFVAYCHDRWDFNEGLDGKGNMLCFPALPGWLIKTASHLAGQVGITIHSEGDKYYLQESDLVKFNEAHAFTTDWVIPLSPGDLSCEI
jgi:hypothetical protein